ncbi:tissue inhibitor of metalloproteinase [Ancylostoma caninum]|uniref:Tissue inhibitor of metalloproteinase n=1 Tax=Ancylostoma caninum TaxID=29170 RepID=A0A368H7H2_ANCCA|nr:tissue inhibitor of metalloproteinase [Ancylostoma caninum]
MISLLVFIACLTSAHAACSCKPYQTVKEAVCKSDFAILAKVMSVNHAQWSYKIWPMRTWKGPRLREALLTTPKREDLCGVPGLTENMEYFLTGKVVKNGVFSFTSCDYLMKLSDLTSEEYNILLELMWYPEKCNEKDESGVTDDEQTEE